MTNREPPQKYFMLTRGRTGSTAILDELGTVPGIVSAQEYFLLWFWPDGNVAPETLTGMFRCVLPFEAWKTHLARSSSASPMSPQDLAVTTRVRRLQAGVGFIPAGLGKYAERLLDRKLYEPYLNYMESAALRNGTDRLIFKLLSNNVTERSGLIGMLKRRGYGVLHLVRNNLVRQVISGQIAQKRGLYNKKNFKSDGFSHHIDVDELERLVRLEKDGVDRDRAILTRMAFDVLEVSYEDFCNDRRQFYATILGFMGLPRQLPRATDYSIITNDLRSLISNYQEIEARVARMGLGDSLAEDRRTAPVTS